MDENPNRNRTGGDLVPKESTTREPDFGAAMKREEKLPEKDLSGMLPTKYTMAYLKGQVLGEEFKKELPGIYLWGINFFLDGLTVGKRDEMSGSAMVTAAEKMDKMYRLEEGKPTQNVGYVDLILEKKEELEKVRLQKIEMKKVKEKGKVKFVAQEAQSG